MRGKKRPWKVEIFQPEAKYFAPHSPDFFVGRVGGGRLLRSTGSSGTGSGLPNPKILNEDPAEMKLTKTSDDNADNRWIKKKLLRIQYLWSCQQRKNTEIEGSNPARAIKFFPLRSIVNAYPFIKLMRQVMLNQPTKPKLTVHKEKTKSYQKISSQDSSPKKLKTPQKLFYWASMKKKLAAAKSRKKKVWEELAMAKKSEEEEITTTRPRPPKPKSESEHWSSHIRVDRLEV